MHPTLRRDATLERGGGGDGEKQVTFRIEDEREVDERAIVDVTAAAFKDASYSDGTEPGILGALRALSALTLSLVAIETIDGTHAHRRGVAGFVGAGERIIGHIAFSPVTIDGVIDGWFGLGPLSVLPERQRTGVGSALVREGVARLEAAGAKGCALIGDPAYYRRFGFVSDGRLTYEGVPDRYVQWLGFGSRQPTRNDSPRDPAPPSGALTFHPAFGTNG